MKICKLKHWAICKIKIGWRTGLWPSSPHQHVCERLPHSSIWPWLPLVKITVTDRPVHTCCEGFQFAFIAHTWLYRIVWCSTAQKKVQKLTRIGTTIMKVSKICRELTKVTKIFRAITKVTRKCTVKWQEDFEENNHLIEGRNCIKPWAFRNYVLLCILLIIIIIIIIL